MVSTDLSLDDFCSVAEQALGLDLSASSSHRSLVTRGATSLFLTAGPGTGKTSALTLLVLKAIFLDGLPPSGILATTFTKKAAAELNSRITDGVLKSVEQLGLPPDDPKYDVSSIRV